jgi:flagellar hook-basal body complex protein FliE
MSALDLATGGLIEPFANGIIKAIIGIDNNQKDESKPIDQRIARLDEAKAALNESLEAIEKLRTDAETALNEHAAVVEALNTALSNKVDAEQKLASIRNIINQEVKAFQTVAGVPNVRQERTIGFFSGVLASIVASGVWTVAPKIFESLTQLLG